MDIKHGLWVNCSIDSLKKEGPQMCEFLFLITICRFEPQRLKPLVTVFIRTPTIKAVGSIVVI